MEKKTKNSVTTLKLVLLEITTINLPMILNSALAINKPVKYCIIMCFYYSVVLNIIIKLLVLVITLKVDTNSDMVSEVKCGSVSGLVHET